MFYLVSSSAAGSVVVASGKAVDIRLWRHWADRYDVPNANLEVVWPDGQRQLLRAL